MLVTLTSRELLALRPRVRSMAGSMERVESTRPRIAPSTVHVLTRHAVSMVETHPTRRTAPGLPFEQCGQAWTAPRMPSAARAPIHPGALIGTAIPPDLALACHGYLTGGEAMPGCRGRRRCGQGATGLPSMPVPSSGPRDGWHGIPPGCPAAELVPPEVIESSIDGWAHPGAVIVCPAPAARGALTEPRALRERLRACDAAAQLRQLCLALGLSRGHQGLASQALACGVAPCVVCPDAVWPAVQPQEGTARLLTLPGMMDRTLGLVACPPYRSQPGHQEWRAVCEALPLLRQHHAVSGSGKAPGLRVHVGNGGVQPRQGNQRSQWGTRPSWWRPGGTGLAVAVCPAPRLAPGFDVAPDARGRRRLGP